MGGVGGPTHLPEFWGENGERGARKLGHRALAN